MRNAWLRVSYVKLPGASPTTTASCRSELPCSSKVPLKSSVAEGESIKNGLHKFQRVSCRNLTTWGDEVPFDAALDQKVLHSNQACEELVLVHRDTGIPQTFEKVTSRFFRGVRTSITMSVPPLKQETKLTRIEKECDGLSTSGWRWQHPRWALHQHEGCQTSR